MHEMHGSYAIYLMEYARCMDCVNNRKAYISRSRLCVDRNSVASPPSSPSSRNSAALCCAVSSRMSVSDTWTYLDALVLKTIETYWGIKLLLTTISVIYLTHGASWPSGPRYETKISDMVHYGGLLPPSWIILDKL